MEKARFAGKEYEVDSEGFLIDHGAWDEDFARGMASTVHIPEGLTDEHWKVIRFVRRSYEERGVCPLIYEACKANGLHLRDLKRLFPTGHMRGACKLAGVTYKEGYVKYSWVEAAGATPKPAVDLSKVYEVDVRGFLVNPDQWDEAWAAHRGRDLGCDDLGHNHWKVIRYLRDSWKNDGAVPTVYQTCLDNDLEIEDLERLFPAGYHRGAVRIAGLRAR